MSDIKELTSIDVHKILAKQYDRCDDGFTFNHRKLFVHKSMCGNGRLGCVFFALEGTPPKGYAVYIPERYWLMIIKPDLTKRVMRNVRVLNEN